MHLSRRTFVAGGAAACLPAFAQPARYPNRPVKIIVPFAPGGGTDGVTRYISQRLSQNHGYTIVVDNKPGAGGNLGVEAFLREPADGYSLLAHSSSYCLNAVFSKSEFDWINGIQPVVQFTREAVVLAIGPNSPYKTLGDLIADAKKRPGQIPYGSSGVGGYAHLAAEYFASTAGVKFNHVPYKGTGAGLIDLAGGQIAFLIAGVQSVAPLHKSGKVRILAVETPARLTSLPTVATFAEGGLPNYKADLWHGLIAPKGVPAEIVAKLNADVNAALRHPEVIAKLANEDVSPGGGTSQAFAETIRSDIERWRGVVKAADIKLT